MDCSLLGSSVHGILQVGILEEVAISFKGDFHDPGIEPKSPALKADSLLSEKPIGQAHKFKNSLLLKSHFRLIKGGEDEAAPLAELSQM